jgi:cardiolipin synthase A/B
LPTTDQIEESKEDGVSTTQVSMVALALNLIVILTLAVALAANRRPASAIAWIMAIVFLPVVGLIAYFFVGVGRLPRHRRERQRDVNQLILSTSETLSQRITPDTPDWLGSAVQLNLNLGALPMVTGNSVRLIEDYVGSFEAMVVDIDAATEYVRVAFYILVLDETTQPVFDALTRARQRGVEVHVLFDFLACHSYPRHRATKRALDEIGVEWRAMLPLRPWRGQWQRPDMRNHRKLVVVDGRVGYTGSQNLIEPSYLKPKNHKRGLHWHELMVRVVGPAVAELDAVFVTDWFSETDEILPVDRRARAELAVPAGLAAESGAAAVDVQVVPSGPSFDNDNNLKLFVLMIQNARSRVSVTSPYFVPDDSTLMAMVTAASRGLEVELFVSAIGDQSMVYHAQRSYYEELLRAGVAIYLYQAPTVLHAKHFSIDDEVAVVGTSNMDIRSFSLNMEVSTLIRGTEFNAKLRAVEDHYRANSTRLVLDEWLKRPLRDKVLDNLARLTSALM